MSKKISIVLSTKQLEIIDNIAKKTGGGRSETIRILLDKGLDDRSIKENEDLITKVVRKQMEVVIKPHIERLAKISAKAGHMAGRSAFLNAQIARDLVPPERRRDVNELWDNAQKKAVAYMKIKVDEYGVPYDDEEDLWT